MCFGRIGLITPFLNQALQRGSEVVLLTEHGILGSRPTRRTGSDPAVRRAQDRVADDSAQARMFASAFVGGRIDNVRVL
ncbi:CRISPR-associated endonuclease Cas1 [Saccharopolyspora cebuensis]|uniref:CRISPR-associated endonuclease Cas1 n=1 Tax=Saccharopolyspora cebuensis TaxID=418759 RepID=A0ABV4CN59_9PSEU